MSSFCKVISAFLLILVCLALIGLNAVIMTRSVFTIIGENSPDTVKKCSCLTFKIYDICVVLLGMAAEAILTYIFIRMCYYLHENKIVVVNKRSAERAGYQTI